MITLLCLTWCGCELIRCNVGAKLMHKYGAHGATDVTGFGIVGHASNLASAQTHAVDFVIHKLPVIRDMVAVAEACGIKFGLLQGYSAETSGISSEFFFH